MATLKGKKALVCGSTQGIGHACAVVLARLGATVTLVARNESALKGVRDELSSEKAQAHDYVCADFGDPPALQRRVAEHVKNSGPIHVLVNNTGGPPGGPITEADPQQFLTAFSNHLVCNHLLVRTLLQGMKEACYGRIINIISTSVIAPIPGLGVSNTIRAAVANWGRTLANELGPLGITVNNVLPGYTDTARLRSLMGKAAERRGISEQELVEAWRNSIPMGRFAQPAEIAEAVGFLASPAASYISGVNLPVDGARCAAQ